MTTHHVATPRQAALLLRPELRPLLNYLMQDARSAADVARHLNLTLGQASYQVGKLQAVGVAVIERVDARAGRSVKRYRVSDRWFIPYEVTAEETLEGFWLSQIGPRMDRIAGFAAAQLWAHSPSWGLWLSGQGGQSQLEIGDAGGPARNIFEGDEPLMLTIAGLRLTEPNARRLKRLLLELMREGGTLESPDAPQYTLSLMFVRGSAE
ncbi:ArsR family transcriptional regulator [Deinococcus sp. A31D244]|uniref:ArsR family transcriptional regulator n=1 Tax=Deinococcus sp. A31D244 TaxID=3397675 RepID=UPI0039DF6D11